MTTDPGSGMSLLDLVREVGAGLTADEEQRLVDRLAATAAQPG